MESPNIKMDTSSLRTADFLKLFDYETGGFKFLTHPCQNSGVDLVEYVYECENRLLDWSGMIHADLFEMVRGYIFGPEWTDFWGKSHMMSCSSDEWVRVILDKGIHPMSDDSFKDDVEAFKNSVRFRRGMLKKHFQEMKEKHPNLDIKISKTLSGADFYAYTRGIADAIDEILDSMEEYSSDHPEVVVSFEDELGGDGTLASFNPSCHHEGYARAVITIEQVGSFPSHDIKRDISKLQLGGGNLSNILHALNGHAEWSIVSGWSDGEEGIQWNICGPDVKRSDDIHKYDNPTGFRHVISVLYKVN